MIRLALVLDFNLKISFRLSHKFIIEIFSVISKFYNHSADESTVTIVLIGRHVDLIEDLSGRTA